MQSSYDRALAEVLEQEGGYTNDPQDPGGPTNWGITIWDARMYWKHDATAADIRAMPLSVAKQIYKSKYWDALSGDELPAGVDLVVFDYGVNSGIHRSAMVLQRLVGTVDDGKIGPLTLAATAKQDPVELINKICDERLAYLQRLSTWPHFGRGWSRRVKEVRALSLELAKGKSDGLAGG